MDVLPRISRQLTDLFRAMPLVQRVTSIVVMVGVLTAFGWLVVSNRSPDYQAVSFGKVFAADELESAEKALIAAGLTGFRRDGQRLLAPAAEQDRYNAALLEFGALPADLGSQMLKHYETLGPFSTDRHRQQMKEALLLQELRRMIKSVPDIDDARVAIASSDRRVSWNQKPRVTANVTLKLRGGREISATLINSLRQAVASMVPDLKPLDVTIFDVTRGQAYTGEQTDDPLDRRYLQRYRELTREYENQIQKALSHIPNVSVTAHVDLEAVKSELVRKEVVRSRGEPFQIANRTAAIEESEPHWTGFRGPDDEPKGPPGEISEKPIVTAMPKSVQVSVSIPRDYVRELISRRTMKGEQSLERLDPNVIEEEVVTKVERIVSRLIPADSAHDAISVTCVDRFENDSNDPASVSANSLESLIHQKWLVGAGCGVFACLMLWMFCRAASVPAGPADSPIVAASVFDDLPSLPVPASTFVESSSSSFIPPDRTALLREEIRSMVASDPAASAAIVIRWLSEARS